MKQEALDREKAHATDDYPDNPGSPDASLDPTAQAGMQRIDAVSAAWSKWSLLCAYAGLGLLACATSLEQQTVNLLMPFATSSFGAHSLLSTVSVVQAIVNSIIKPPMGKIADAFGRFESFTFAVVLYTIGYIQQAASNSINTYASAQIFYAAGSQGLLVLQQIFVADTTDLLDRALFSTIPDLPFLATIWIGPEVAGTILPNWRWGYGMWAIVLPAAFSPLALSLLLYQRRASKMSILLPSPFKGKNVFFVLKSLWYELDFFGFLLLTAAISLVLIPLTIATRQSDGWESGMIVAMLVVGNICLVGFVLWESSERLAPKAFFPRDLFKDRTVLAGTSIAFFYFMAYYLSVYPYYSSYLMIVQNKGVIAAGRITQAFTFASTVSSVVVSLVIRLTGRYKYFITFGACIYMMGLGLMYRYRVGGASTAALVGCQIVTGFGGGMLVVPAQLGVQASASHEQVTTATVVFLTMLEIGGAVGNAISGAIWTNSVPGKLERLLPEAIRDQASLIYGNVTLASTGWAMGTPERMAINRAYDESMRMLLTVAVCVAAPLVPLSLAMKNHRFVKGQVIGAEPDAGRSAGGVDAGSAAAGTRARGPSGLRR
ncbi:siderophore iron transporter mirc [Diplodia corticola]|uniref:Siderophore iron transporter mirc n=1 Tax=Diplodia corticola TaxID=236234 RepID=A0A1J9R371_9PEZI|nr:siderophore iron transporter mirc [Diplodia corticola]OJD35025.1 siderophore iron transporter mirc [Diplodia corticola]